MATLRTQSTEGVPITVIYPAEQAASHLNSIRFRVGKKTALPAYTHASLPHLVQFQHGQQTIMFMLSDILETSFWRRIRNAYNLFGQLHIDTAVKVDAKEVEKIVQWLRQESAGRGIASDGVEPSLIDDPLYSQRPAG